MSNIKVDDVIEEEVVLSFQETTEEKRLPMGEGEPEAKVIEVKKEKKIKVKEKSRLGKRLIKIMTNSLIIIAVLFLAGSIYTYSKDIDKIYKDKLTQVATTVSELADGDLLAELAVLIHENDYRKMYENASNEYQLEIVEYLKERGLAERYEELYKMMADVRKRMDVAYLYIEVIENDKAYFLAEPDARFYGLGFEDSIPDAFGKLNKNGHVKPTITFDDWGWLCTGGEPVYDSAGNTVAIVFVDLDMTWIMKKRIWFFSMMAIVLLVSLIIARVIYSRFLFKTVISPIKELTDAAERFGTKETGFDKENIVSLDIKTGDEIEDMYHEFNYMQESIVDYMENLQSVTAERERVGAEIEIATSIQQGMLEKLSPNFTDKKEYDLYAQMRPAREVGGDFYDFFMVDDDHLAILIADVSDKGVGAAFFMAISKTLIKTYSQTGLSPAEILAYVDKRLAEKNDAGLFVTVWLGIIDLNTGHMKVCNAGHDYPAIMKAGEEYTIEKTPHGPPLAFIPGLEFPEIEYDLGVGDRIFLYTDGVNEAKRPDEERFGTDRMLEFLNSHKEESCEEQILGMTKAVDEFAGEEPQFDDMTMLGFTFRGRASA